MQGSYRIEYQSAQMDMVQKESSIGRFRALWSGQSWPMGELENTFSTLTTAVCTIISNLDVTKALQDYVLKQNRRVAHLGALSTIFMIVFPIFFQQALETRIKLIEDTAIPCNLTYGTDYTSGAPVYIRDEGKPPNSTFKCHPKTFTAANIHTPH